MSKPIDNPPPGSYHEESTAGSNAAVKIVAIIAAVVLGMFFVCAGIVCVVVQSARSSWDKNVHTFLDRADREAEKAQAWHEKNVEQSRAEWAKQDADRGEAKRFADSFLTALGDHRFADAYRETTATFRQQFPSEKALEQFTRTHSALARPATLIDEDFAQQGGTRRRFSGMAIEGEMLDMKPVKVLVIVMKEGLNWKADELTVSNVFPGVPAPSTEGKIVNGNSPLERGTVPPAPPVTSQQE